MSDVVPVVLKRVLAAVYNLQARGLIVGWGLRHQALNSTPETPCLRAFSWIAGRVQCFFQCGLVPGSPLALEYTILGLGFGVPTHISI